MLSLDAAQSTVTVSEPVFGVLAIANRLSEEIAVDLGHDRKGNLTLNVTEPDGRRVSVAGKQQEGIGRIARTTLRAGESYNQRILLNEWYSFERPGTYAVEVSLAGPARAVTGRAVSIPASKPTLIKVNPRDARRLKAVCERLAKTVIGTSDVETATEAALALSYVRDPIAVPFLERVLKEARLVGYHALTGLARIANAEAVKALIAATREGDAELRSQAVYALSQAKANVKDEALKRQIEQALRNHG